ncbi:MAG: hypothetical protein LH618_00500 [Saprospiraceae bacterium]|nr:hypothetical protein [Saprospiraceae bacterium]
MKILFSLLFGLLCASAAQAQTEYASVDSIARTIKKSGYSTPDALAKALCKNLKTDRDKARAIFTWVAENMRYDFKAIGREGPSADTQEEYRDKRAKEAYKKGRGVCMDYALVYKKMAEAVGLECAYVTGNSKGSVRGGWADHAWNAVKINGQWQLLDATWGSGYGEGNNEFHQAFLPGHFLPLPRIFALTHFPDDEKWQLLDKPIDKKEFKNQPVFSYGDLVSDIMDTEPFGVPLTKGADGKVELRLKIQQPPEVIKLKMSGRDIKFESSDKDGWLTLRFVPAGRELQVWGGERTKQGIHTTLMAIFTVQ